jgi:hypothetical protein
MIVSVIQTQLVSHADIVYDCVVRFVCSWVQFRARWLVCCSHLEGRPLETVSASVSPAGVRTGDECHRTVPRARQPAHQRTARLVTRPSAAAAAAARSREGPPRAPRANVVPQLVSVRSRRCWMVRGCGWWVARRPRSSRAALARGGPDEDASARPTGGQREGEGEVGNRPACVNHVRCARRRRSAARHPRGAA